MASIIIEYLDQVYIVAWFGQQAAITHKTRNPILPGSFLETEYTMQLDFPTDATGSCLDTEYTMHLDFPKKATDSSECECATITTVYPGSPSGRH